MQLRALTPAESLEKTYRLQPNTREEVDSFKRHFTRLLGHINERESEENVKDHLMDFLKEVYYKDAHVVAPKGKTDFVIHLGKDATTQAGVLFEVKRPANKGEMITRQSLNAKAFHELLLYYFQERERSRNSDIRHCVVTNVYEWFIFDAALIDRLFYRNTHLAKEYKAWATGQKVSRNNELFYNEIARPFLTQLAADEAAGELPFTYFDLRDYQANVADQDKVNDKALLSLFKVLSPTHLLKLPAATDSNRLNPKFYAELLHLIGLEEIKDKGKKIIRRKEAGNGSASRRDEGSLLENTIIELDTANKLSHIQDRTQYGATKEEQLFGLALELCITWVNRILFLKLLESQLVKYHNGNQEYAFLKPDMIADFDELNKLFFRVLAIKPSERQASIQAKFGKIPYLNSSLFEITELEDRTISVNGLDNGLKLPLLSRSVLKDNPAYKHTGELNTLAYLFAFLDAYDFASESREEIQEKNRTLINASVLGLIFEKINGYKDGSFYTPGFITEYMCRETIRKAVVQKFNDAKGWHCANFDDLANKDFDLTEANTLINEIRLCDPAVGSGHFLVSALNELIAVKSDLRVLQDEKGKRLRGYTVGVLNDELVVLDEEDEPFNYQLQPTTGKPTAERQRIQKTLFLEKQTIIESCLFGVDINPNSVKICRLRLWIELLKNAYYTDESGFAELETLPNIDINIKQGNSLLSKFSLTEDLSDVFRKQKFSLNAYKDAVRAYKDAKSKDAKAELARFISEIKSQFRESVMNRDPRRKKLADLRGKRALLDVNIDLFGNTIKDAKLVEVEKKRYDKLIEQAETDIADAESNVLYRGSFEWRFEFPEVLNEKGGFVGFDAVIGNPPYIRQEELGESKKLLKVDFPKTYAGTADLYVMFVEHGLRLLRPKGHFVYIIPNKWLRAGYGENLRKWLKTLAVEQIADFGDLPVFDEATTYPSILSIQNAPATGNFKSAQIDTLTYPDGLAAFFDAAAFEVKTDTLQDEGWQLTNAGVQQLIAKLRAAGKPLGEYVQGKIYYGIKTGLNEAFVIDAATKDRLITEDPRSADVIKPFLAGRDVKRYQTPKVDKYLILLEKGVTNRKRKGEDADIWLKTTYPPIYEWLKPFENKARIRADKGEYWWELRACDYYNEFETKKIVFPDIGIKVQAMYDIEGTYCVNTAYFIPEAEKYLIAIMNSNTVLYFYTNLSTAIRGGYLRFFKQYVEQIPVPFASSAQKEMIGSIVDQILAIKAADSTADTSALEAEIDKMVYELYGLTEAEIAIVEGR
ncbi:class I SAM-dependent DNA methyltransferase [Spirosoma sp. KUDC1026]|uniref:class I SAM-dependent DNA methyltransferase n=1 Tax=Spirosoma sp. KUDC1026 TaxID=2745947 RepID=UPI00159BD08E|nr:TaqI-like C-terminal specificity domain-containing protein [Spirosoma sp. KUDC1026]QKZ14396.1 Eco57I restriction-modification methylase domain-containing protein [Spirosoma sp. KUDC1026]